MHTTKDLGSAFPLPPKYYKSYTTENVSRLETDMEIDESIMNLKPPKPPKGPFVVFGEQDNVYFTFPSLHELKIAPLDFETNHLNQQEKLKLLNRKILQSAVELLNVMIHDTPNANKKMEQLRLLLIHFHHGLNEYRPHQARETLMLIMKKQIEKKKQAIDAINSALSETKTKCNEVYINLKK